MKHTKVIFIFGLVLPVGGNVTFLKHVSNYLAKNNFSVYLFTFGGTITELDPRIRTYNLGSTEGLRILFQSTIKVMKAISHFLEKGVQPDIILTDLYRITLYVHISKLFSKKLRYIPHLYQFHGSDTLERNFAGTTLRSLSMIERCKLFLESKVIGHSSIVICFSNYAKHLLVSTLHVPIQKITVIPPGIGDTMLAARDRKTARKKLGFSATKKIALLIGRTEDRKGFPLFFSLLEENFKDYADTLFIFATNIKSEGFFFLTVPQLPNLLIKHLPTFEYKSLLYQAADVTIVPSLDLETFGFVTQESLTQGTPVIGYDIGANSELIETELLADVRNPISLLKKTRYFFRNKNQLQKKIALRRKSFVKKFSWKKYVTFVEKTLL